MCPAFVPSSGSGDVLGSSVTETDFCFLGVSEADSLFFLPQMHYIHFDLNVDAFEKADFRRSDVK